MKTEYISTNKQTKNFHLFAKEGQTSIKLRVAFVNTPDTYNLMLSTSYITSLTPHLQIKYEKTNKQTNNKKQQKAPKSYMMTGRS